MQVCCELSAYVSYAATQNSQVQSNIVWLQERGPEPPGYPHWPLALFPQENVRPKNF